MRPGHVSEHSLSPYVGAAIFGAAYFAAAEIGHLLSYHAQDQVFATFWPAAGLFLVVLVLTRESRTLLLLILAAWTANLASDVLLHEKTLAVSLGFCAANTSEACIGACLLRQAWAYPMRLTRPREVLWLVGAAGLVSTMIGATIGAGTVSQAYPDSDFLAAWSTWWISDAIGVLVLAPLLFSWSAGIEDLFRKGWRLRTLEGGLLLTGAVTVGAAIYGDWMPPPFNVPIFILPFLIWAPLRFGPRVATLVILLVSLVGVWNTSQGRGPYAVLAASPREQLLRAQGTLAVISLTVLLLAAAVAERNQAERERLALIAKLQQALAEVKTLRGMIRICAWCKRIRDDQDYWHSVEDYIADHTEARLSHGVCPECYAREMDKLTMASP